MENLIILLCMVLFLFGLVSCLAFVVFVIVRINNMHQSIVRTIVKTVSRPMNLHLQICPNPRTRHDDEYYEEDEEDEDEDDYDDYDYDDAKAHRDNLKARYAQREEHLNELRAEYITERVSTLSFPEIEKQIREVERALENCSSIVEKSIQIEQLSLLNTIYVLKDSGNDGDVARKWTDS